MKTKTPLQRIRAYLNTLKIRSLSPSEFLDTYNLTYNLCSTNNLDKEEYAIGGKEVYDLIVSFMNEYVDSVCVVGLCEFVMVNDSVVCTCTRNQIDSKRKNQTHCVRDTEKEYNDSRRIKINPDEKIHSERIIHPKKSPLHIQILTFNRILSSINSIFQYVTRYYIKINQIDSFNTIFYNLTYKKIVAKMNAQYFLKWNRHDFINELIAWSDNEYAMKYQQNVSDKDMAVNQDIAKDVNSYETILSKNKVPVFDHNIISFFYTCLKYSDNLPIYKDLLTSIFDVLKNEKNSIFYNRLNNFLKACKIGKSSLIIEMKSYFTDHKETLINEIVYNLLFVDIFWNEIVDGLSLRERIYGRIVNLVMKNKMFSLSSKTGTKQDKDNTGNHPLNQNLKTTEDEFIYSHLFVNHILIKSIPLDSATKILSRKYFTLSLLNKNIFHSTKMTNLINQEFKIALQCDDLDHNWVIEFINYHIEKNNLENLELISHYIANFDSYLHTQILQNMYKRIILSKSNLEKEKFISNLFFKTSKYYKYSMGWHDYMAYHKDYNDKTIEFINIGENSVNSFKSAPFEMKIFTEPFCPLIDVDIQLNSRIDHQIARIKVKENHKLIVNKLLSYSEIEVGSSIIECSLLEASILFDLIDLESNKEMKNGYQEIINEILSEERNGEVVPLEMNASEGANSNENQISIKNTIKKLLKFNILRIINEQLQFNSENSTRINIYDPCVRFINEKRKQKEENKVKNDVQQIIKCKVIQIMKKNKSMKLEELSEMVLSMEFGFLKSDYESAMSSLIENGYLEKIENEVVYVP